MPCSKAPTEMQQVRNSVKAFLIWEREKKIDIEFHLLSSLFACWKILHAFMSWADFSKLTLKKTFRNTIRASNSLDPDQA